MRIKHMPSISTETRTIKITIKNADERVLAALKNGLTLISSNGKTISLRTSDNTEQQGLLWFSPVPFICRMQYAMRPYSFGPSSPKGSIRHTPFKIKSRMVNHVQSWSFMVNHG